MRSALRLLGRRAEPNFQTRMDPSEGMRQGVPVLEGAVAPWQHERAKTVVSMARRHATEIRTAAEREAEQILHDAEQKAEALLRERREAWQVELDRTRALRQDIASSLDIAVTALQRARELSSAQTAGAVASDTHQPSSEASLAPPSDAEEGTEGADQRSSGLPSMLHLTILIVWGALMLSIAVLLAIPSAGEMDGAVLQAEDRGSPARAPVSATQQAAAPATTEARGLTITLIATRDCWISVASDDGAPTERLLKASETFTVRARDVVTLKAGNAAALSLQINDQATMPLGSEGQVVTRRITSQNYRTFLASR